MNETFEMHAPHNALKYLERFDAPTRRKGEVLFRESRVGSWTAIEPGWEYEAVVEAQETFQVALYYDEFEGWMGECSCPAEFDCEHVYAAMKALLAENSVAEVRGLSSTLASKRKKVRSPWQPKPPPESQLVSLLTAAIGRDLQPQEATFLRKFKQVYDRCRAAQRITRWDFSDLGLPLPGNSWDPISIWPSFPKDEHQFWLGVANAAQEHGLRIPKFLEPVTDLDGFREQVAEWRREQEVMRWQQTFSTFGNQLLSGAGASRGVFDLRLIIFDQFAALQWLRPGQEAFETLKTKQFKQLAGDYENGRIEFTTEAEMLWQMWEERVDYGRGPEIFYQAYQGLGTLGRVLHTKALENRVVNEDGQPMLRAGPLRWKLEPTEDGSGDYRVRLVKADDTPAPPLLFMLDGHAPLYVSRHTIFSGPAVCRNVLAPHQENRIPGPALESQSGVEFLQALQIELPPSIAQQVRHVPMEVAIQCELKPIYPGSKTEQCVVRIAAESGDGRLKESWDGQNWFDPNYRAPRSPRKKTADGTIVVYDRSTQYEVPRLLEPLGLKYDNYADALSLRVKKKFPELFVPWLKSLPPHIHVQLAGDLASLAEDAVAGKVRLDVTETTIDWFDLQVVLDVEDTTLTPAEIKLLLNAKGSYVRLENKGWRRLQFNLDSEEDERLARLGLNPARVDR